MKREKGFVRAFRVAEPRPDYAASQKDKKNYAERLSRKIAQVFADALRDSFPGILPTVGGERQESRARTGKGFKKLDINYSTVELGLALGVSIKTINFPDATTKRFTKNYSRVDNELRAEAIDYHRRQPYSVMIGVLFLPVTSCEDSNSAKGDEKGLSSFCAAVKYFRGRSGRETSNHDPELFEKFFVALYEVDTEGLSAARFFDVENAPPRARRPRDDETTDLAGAVKEITAVYDSRNNPPFIAIE
jgi:hypothetical protein